MPTIVAKSVVFGVFLGAMASIVLSLLTASASGRNVMTGEPMELRGFKAIYVQLAENGPYSCPVSLLPSFLVLSVVATLVVAVLLTWLDRTE